MFPLPALLLLAAPGPCSQAAIDSAISFWNKSHRHEPVAAPAPGQEAPRPEAGDLSRGCGEGDAAACASLALATSSAPLAACSAAALSASCERGEPDVCPELATLLRSWPTELRERARWEASLQAGLQNLERRCGSDDPGGCASLCALVERASWVAGPKRSLELVERACDRGHGAGCVASAALYQRGMGGAPAAVEPALEKGCGARWPSARACSELADAVAARGDLARDRALRRRACELDDSQCFARSPAELCGNGRLDVKARIAPACASPGSCPEPVPYREPCDGEHVSASCEEQGYGGGRPTCSSACALDWSGCSAAAPELRAEDVELGPAASTLVVEGGGRVAVVESDGRGFRVRAVGAGAFELGPAGPMTNPPGGPIAALRAAATRAGWLVATQDARGTVSTWIAGRDGKVSGPRQSWRDRRIAFLASDGAGAALLGLGADAALLGDDGRSRGRAIRLGEVPAGQTAAVAASGGFVLASLAQQGGRQLLLSRVGRDGKVAQGTPVAIPPDASGPQFARGRPEAPVLLYRTSEGLRAAELDVHALSAGPAIRLGGPDLVPFDASVSEGRLSVVGRAARSLHAVTVDLQEARPMESPLLGVPERQGQGAAISGRQAFITLVSRRGEATRLYRVLLPAH